MVRPVLVEISPDFQDARSQIAIGGGSLKSDIARHLDHISSLDHFQATVGIHDGKVAGNPQRVTIDIKRSPIDNHVPVNNMIFR